MFEIVKAGGIMMVPIILCSIIAAAIILERLWTLQQKRVLPADLTEKVWRWVEGRQLEDKHIAALEHNSPLGEVLAAGIVNRNQPREIVKESVEDTGRHVVHELERFLTTLGTIAAMSPFLGLLGTVLGIIRTFNAISSEGVGNPTALAGGIAEALIATAAGLFVAIPSLVGYRYLRRRVETLVVHMEKEAMKLVRAIDAQNSGPIAGARVVGTMSSPPPAPAQGHPGHGHLASAQHGPGHHGAGQQAPGPQGIGPQGIGPQATGQPAHIPSVVHGHAQVRGQVHGMGK